MKVAPLYVQSKLISIARQVWLQELAWLEADKPIKLAARAAMSPNDPKLEKQPLFCYESMLKLLYWSCLVYDHERVSFLINNLLNAALQTLRHKHGYA